MDQVTLFDLVNENDREKITPGVWDCLDTCANFTNLNADGTRDYFPETREPRCTNMCFKSRLINNYWRTTCKNYKPKG